MGHLNFELLLLCRNRSLNCVVYENEWMFWQSYASWDDETRDFRQNCYYIYLIIYYSTSTRLYIYLFRIFLMDNLGCLFYYKLLNIGMVDWNAICVYFSSNNYLLLQIYGDKYCTLGTFECIIISESCIIILYTYVHMYLWL